MTEIKSLSLVADDTNTQLAVFVDFVRSFIISKTRAYELTQNEAVMPPCNAKSVIRTR